MAALAAKLLTLAACALPLPALAGELATPLKAGVDGVFTRLVEEAQRDFAQPGPLHLCPHGVGAPADGAPAVGGSCRRGLKHEPQDARELLPFLLKDPEAMGEWRAHFHRHVTEALGGAAATADAQELPLQHAPGLVAVGEAQFWQSRPAVSAGALAYLKLKMEHLKLLAAASGSDSKTAVTWEAEVSPRFKGQSMKDAAVLMGTYLSAQPNPDKAPVPLGAPLPPRVFADPEKRVEAESFDAREAFPECKAVIGRVRDQGSCGSCWALASTEALNDRFCIKSRGKALEMLSTQDTVSCCDLLHCLSLGCNGGQPRMAWRWFGRDGVVTGGEYDDLNTGKSCRPYEVPFCQHHTEGPYPPCSGLADTPKCRKSCEEAYEKNVKPFHEDKHYAAKSFSVHGRDQIKRELVENGPLSGAFMVYEDFLMYKSGVYHHVTGSPVGGHAVKVVGFGRQDSRDYWLAINSWNTYWGDKGTFKIEMGEGGIDSEFCGGEAKVAGQPEGSFRKQAGQDL